MVQVASESLLDRSKSIKSEVMALLESESIADVEGVDHAGESISGLTALRTCVHWVQSGSWDGRWAVAVCCDAASDWSRHGSCSVAVLVGPLAPLYLRREYSSHICRPLNGYKFEEVVPNPKGEFHLKVLPEFTL